MSKKLNIPKETQYPASSTYKKEISATLQNQLMQLNETMLQVHTIYAKDSLLKLAEVKKLENAEYVRERNLISKLEMKAYEAQEKLDALDELGRHSHSDEKSKLKQEIVDTYSKIEKRKSVLNNGIDFSERKLSVFHNKKIQLQDKLEYAKADRDTKQIKAIEQQIKNIDTKIAAHEILLKHHVRIQEQAKGLYQSNLELLQFENKYKGIPTELIDSKKKNLLNELDNKAINSRINLQKSIIMAYQNPELCLKEPKQIKSEMQNAMRVTKALEQELHLVANTFIKPLMQHQQEQQKRKKEANTDTTLKAVQNLEKALSKIEKSDNKVSDPFIVTPQLTHQFKTSRALSMQPSSTRHHAKAPTLDEKENRNDKRLR
jgi:hypothetical protein